VHLGIGAPDHDGDADGEMVKVHTSVGEMLPIGAALVTLCFGWRCKIKKLLR